MYGNIQEKNKYKLMPEQNPRGNFKDTIKICVEKCVYSWQILNIAE
jgi:hypothetical protein